MQYLFKTDDRTGQRQAQHQRRRALSFVLAIPVASAFAVVPSHARQLYYQAERPYVESVQQRMVAHRARAAQLFSIVAPPVTVSDAPQYGARTSTYRAHYPVFDNQEPQRDARRPTFAPPRWERTRAAPSGSRPLGAGWSVCAPVGAGSAGME